MKLRLIIVLAFCVSGCYSHLQYTKAIYNSSNPIESTPSTAEEIFVVESENWYFNGINYYPYYKDYSQAGWFSMPSFYQSYSFLTSSGVSFYPILTSASTKYDSGQSAGNSYFANPILICWNPQIYPANAYRPSNIHILISLGTANNGRVKKSKGLNHGPRTIGPNRVTGSSVLPDRNRSTNISKGQRSSAGRSLGSSGQNKSRGN